MFCYSNNTLSHTVRQAIIGSELIVNSTLLIGGIFILLASLQVLPHGVNVISHTGIWGFEIGSDACLLSVFGSSLMTVQILRIVKKKILSNPLKLKNKANQLPPTQEKSILSPPQSEDETINDFITNKEFFDLEAFLERTRLLLNTFLSSKEIQGTDKECLIHQKFLNFQTRLKEKKVATQAIIQKEFISFIEEIRAEFTEASQLISLLQPVTEKEFKIFKHMIKDSLIIHLKTDFAKELLEEKIKTLSFINFSFACDAIEEIRHYLIQNLKSEIESTLIPEEFRVKLIQRQEETTTPDCNDQTAFKLLLVKDIDAFLPTLPKSYHKWLVKQIMSNLNVKAENYIELRLKILQILPILLEKEIRRRSEKDLNIINLFLSKAVVNHKILYFIKERPKEKKDLFLSKEEAQNRIEKAVPKELISNFDGLLAWIEASDKVDRVLFDYFVKTIISKKKLLFLTF